MFWRKINELNKVNIQILGFFKNPHSPPIVKTGFFSTNSAIFFDLFGIFANFGAKIIVKKTI